jgi:hypothetical protein
MNSRNNVHRTRQWQVAERQRYLADLEALRERLCADLERLREEIGQAGGDHAVPANARLDPLFIRPLIDRREKLLGSIGEIEAQIGQARTALVSAQQEARLVEGGMIHSGFSFEDRLTRRARRSM